MAIIKQINWQKSPMIWRDGTNEYISVVFTWDLPSVKALCLQQTIGIDCRIVGGPAVAMMPEYLKGIKNTKIITGHDLTFINYPTLHRFNPLATRTTSGCPNSCQFCAVKKIYPHYSEFLNWEAKPIICDDNLLACSQKHFDKVIDKLKRLDWCDFNQGLDARLLYQYHANRFAELKNSIIRLAWDNLKNERYILNAITALRKAKIPRKNIRCYVLIGWQDTPEDALYRLETLWHGLGIKPNPMRYQPLDCLEKNSYVAPEWTHKELDRFMSYWSNLRYVGGVPFAEYIHNPGHNK